MDRTPVKSSNVKAVGYEPESLLLEVEFLGSGIYRYQPVSSAFHAEMMDPAISVGGKINEIKGMVRAGEVACTRVEEAA